MAQSALASTQPEVPKMSLQVQYEAIVYDLICSVAGRLHSSLAKELTVDFLLANRSEYKLSMHILKQIFRLRLLERKDDELQKKQFSDSCGSLEKLLSSTLRQVQKSPKRRSSQDSSLSHRSDLQLSTERSKSPNIVKMQDSMIQSSIEENVEAEAAPDQATFGKHELDTLYTQQTSQQSVQEHHITPAVVIVNYKQQAKERKPDILPVLALSGERHHNTAASPRSNIDRPTKQYTTQGSAASFGRKSIVKSSEPMILAVGPPQNFQKDQMQQYRLKQATKESNRTTSRGTESTFIGGQSTRVNSRQQSNPRCKQDESSNGVLSGFAERDQITPDLYQFKHHYQQLNQTRVNTTGTGKRRLMGNSKIMPVYGIDLQRNRSKDKLSTKETVMQKKLYSDAHQSMHTNSFGLMDVVANQQQMLSLEPIESNVDSNQPAANLFHTSSMGSMPSIPENQEEGKTSRGVTSRESQKKVIASMIDNNQQRKISPGRPRNLACDFERTGDQNHHEIPQFATLQSYQNNYTTNDYISPHDNQTKLNATLPDFDDEKMMPQIKHIRNPKFRTTQGDFVRSTVAKSYAPVSEFSKGKKTTTPQHIVRNGVAFKSAQRMGANRGIVSNNQNKLIKNKRHSHVPISDPTNIIINQKAETDRHRLIESQMFNVDSDGMDADKNMKTIEEPKFNHFGPMANLYDSTGKSVPRSNLSSERKHYLPITKSKSGSGGFKLYGKNNDQNRAAFASLQFTNSKQKK